MRSKLVRFLLSARSAGNLITDLHDSTESADPLGADRGVGQEGVAAGRRVALQPHRGARADRRREVADLASDELHPAEARRDLDLDRITECVARARRRTA